MSSHKLLSLDEAAALLSIHPMTLHKWAQAGKIPVVQAFPRSARKFRRTDVMALLAPKVKGNTDVIVVDD